MKNDIILHRLHDSVIDSILIDKSISHLKIILSNFHSDIRNQWEINIYGLLAINAKSSYSMVRDYLDVFDVVVIRDSECIAWEDKIIECGVDDKLGKKVHRLLFGTTAFDDDIGQGGIVIYCRKYTVTKLI